MGPDRSTAYDLSTSFTTSSLSAPFPVLTAAQHRTISRIIAAHPPTETFSWASLEGTYSRLDIDEDEIQPLLLKLSLEVGRSWSDKWESAKASLEERGELPGDGVRAGSLDVLKARLDNIPRAPRRPPSSPAAAPQASTFSAAYSPRPKSAPFDAPRPPPSTTPRAARDFLVQSGYEGYHSSSSDDYVGVPDSERTISLISASAILSSTPRTSLAPKRASLPPPSHVHPISPSLPLHSLRPATTELELNGAKFRYLSHVGKGFDKWCSSFLRRQAERAKADESRRVLLLRTPLLKWRDRLGELRELQRNLRDAERAWKRGSLSRGFARWVGKIEKRRREEERVKTREKEVRREEKVSRLREAFEVVRTRWSERARREFFEHWRQTALESRAARFRRVNLFRKSLRVWHARQSQLANLAVQADRFAKERILVAWMRKGELQYLEQNFVRRKEEVAKRDCWEWWRTRSRESKQRRRLERLADLLRKKAHFGTWRARFSQVLSLDDHCDALLHTKSLHILRSSLTHWRTSYLGHLLTRSHALRSAPPLLASCLDQWITRYEHVQIELEGRATALLNRSRRSVIDGCMSQWIDALDKRRRFAEEGEAFGRELERKRAKACLEVWREVVVRRGVEAIKADVSRTFFLQRKGWNAWAKALWKRRLARAEEGLARRKKGEVFAFWLADMRKAKAMQVLVEDFQAVVDQRFLRDAVSKWTSRVVELRARELQVHEDYEKRLLKLAFTKWTEVCLRREQQYSLAESCRLVAEEGTLRRAFAHWLKSTRKIAELDRRLSEQLEGQRLTTLVVVYERLRERSLRSREEAMVVKRLTRELGSALLLWKERTKTLPAIQRDRINTRRKMFDIWRDQVPNPAWVRQAVERDRASVTAHCFNLWRIKYHARTAVRSVNRFRSFAASSGSGSSPSSATRSSANTSSSLPLSSPRPFCADNSVEARPSPPQPKPTFPTARSPPFASRPRLSADFASSPATRASASQDGSEDRGMEGVRARLRAAAANRRG